MMYKPRRCPAVSGIPTVLDRFDGTRWLEDVWHESALQRHKLMPAQAGKRSNLVPQKVTVVALNDYKVDVPMADFHNFPVILAYRMDGEALRIKDKGPLWIIYPQDEFPELKNKQTQNKWVWQVKEIQIR